MKRILMALLVVVLIGKMSITEWDTAPKNIQVEFLKYLAQNFCYYFNCESSKVRAFEKDNEMIFTGECVEEVESERTIM